MRVIAALHSADTPRGVREVVDLCGLSVAGVHDVLRRLHDAEVVVRIVIGKRPLLN